MTSRPGRMWFIVGVILLVGACTPIEYARVSNDDTPTPTEASSMSYIDLVSTQIYVVHQTATAEWDSRKTQTKVAATTHAINDITATAAAPTVNAGWTQIAAASATGAALADQSTATATAAQGYSTATAASVHLTQNAIVIATIQAQMRTAQAPLSALPVATPPFKWPMPPFTKDQLAEARACDIAALASSRYPSTLDAGALRASFEPGSPCDWAALAAAYAARLKPGEPPSNDALLAYDSAVLLNPAYSLTGPLYYGYFGRAALVEPPPAAHRVVRMALVAYSKRTPDDRQTLPPGSFILLITDADTRPEYHGSVYQDLPEPTHLPGFEKSLTSRTVGGSVGAASIQAILGGLSDLVPVMHGNLYGEYLDRCSDDPRISIGATLYLDDGSEISLGTNRHTYVHGGGPWEVTIDGQDYLQTGPQMTQIFSQLAVELGLPDTPLDTRLAPSTGCEIDHHPEDLLSQIYPREDN